MKTLTRIIIAAIFSLSVLSSHAQFISSNSGDSNKETDQSAYESDRQKDILILEQKAQTIESDLYSGNIAVFDTHKSEVLTIMDREISRSGYDFSNLKMELGSIDPDSQEGRALRIKILQMDGRINKQKFLRSKVIDFTSDKISVDNTRELTALKSEYFQFIDIMKTNLRDIDGINTEQSLH